MTSGVFPPDIIAAAKASRAKWDIPASICLAQWALESNWGAAMPAGSNNPFGIKAVGAQPSVASKTHEVINGFSVTVTSHFRVFSSVAEAFEAHGALLATAAPYAEARKVRHDAEAFARALTGVYATDPHYGEKLIAIMRASKLQDEDGPAVPAYSARQSSPPPIATHQNTWFERLCMALTFRKAA